MSLNTPTQPKRAAPTRPAILLALAIGVMTLLLANPAAAIQPEEWVHSSESDFADGQTDGTVITNLGDVKLAIGSETLAELPEEGSIIYDLQRIGETVYIAAGAEGKLLRKDNDGVETILELPSEQVFALAATEAGELVVAISGEPTRLAVLDEESSELETLVELEDVRYIWQVLAQGAPAAADASFVLATGTNGKVLRVRPDEFDAEAEPNPGLEVLLETRQSNVLSLAHDPERERYFAGTDVDGLIYRISFNDAGEPEPFVVYDAPEPEIGALVVGDDGTVFAGTADAEQARPGRLEEAQRDPAGRPGEPEPVGEPPEPDEPPADPDVPEAPPEPDPMDEAPEQAPDPEDAEANDEPADDAPLDPAPEDAPDEAPPVEDEDPAELMGQAGVAASAQVESADARVLEAQAPAPHPQGEPEEPEEVGEPEEPEDEPGIDAVTEPTPEQRDQLRAEIRSRLERARDGGELQVEPGDARRAAVGQRAERQPRAQPPRRDRPSRDGNAIYRIDDEGFVTEVFRESVMILDMIHLDDRLLVATGNEGQLYSVRPGADETSMTVELDPEQITALLPGPDGEVLLGTANPAYLLRLDRDHAGEGTYTSPVLDAEQISLWGMLRLTARIPEGTSLTLETRSGNVRDPEDGPWSAWSQPQSFLPDESRSHLHPRKMEVQSPPARFLQYRVRFDGTADATPALTRVALAYVMPNMPPRLTSIQASYPDAGRGRGGRGGDDEEAPSRTMNVDWDAEDPNDDRLRYTLEYRPADSERFIEIADDIERSEYEWNTRRVPDGWYTLRVTASDHLDNPPDMAMTSSRVSEPVLVDNTAPVFEDLDKQVADDRVTITGVAVDRHSRIASIGHALNHAENYEPILPEDMIFDSTREPWSVTLSGLDSGQHVVTLRVRDQRGNTSYESLVVEIE